MESEGLHVVVVDDVETEVEQRLFALFALQQRAHREFQLVEHDFIDDAAAVGEIAQKLVLVDSLQVGVAHLDGACPRLISLNLISHFNINYLRFRINVKKTTISREGTA